MGTAPWFAEPRAAVAAVLGEERAQFACAFGRLGVVSEAVAAHESAGLEHVEARVLHGSMDVRDAGEHWEQMTRRIGHFSRLAAALSASERCQIESELGVRLACYEEGARLVLPRAIVLVTARAAAV